MKKLTVTTTLAAGLICGATLLAPVAGADTAAPASGPVSTASSHEPNPLSAKSGAPLGDQGFGVDPLIPDGTDPQSPVRLGYIDRNHDEGNTSNGEVDVPF